MDGGGVMSALNIIFTTDQGVFRQIDFGKLCGNRQIQPLLG